MDEFYLNDTNREFYERALKYIRSCGDEFWNLDDALDKHIDLINSSENVRTMYSRRGRNRSGAGLESYLKICYTKDVETRIRSSIEPFLRNVFSSEQWCELNVQYNPPKTQVGNKKAADFLKYIEDDNYWNVFHIKFELKGSFDGNHDKFWTILSESLSSL